MATADERTKVAYFEVELNKKGASASLSLFFHCRRCGFVLPVRLLSLAHGPFCCPAGGSLEQMDLYKGTRFLTFEGSPDGLRVQNFRMPVLGYDLGPKPLARTSRCFTYLPYRVTRQRDPGPDPVKAEGRSRLSGLLRL
jgi:hypothetical protein